MTDLKAGVRRLLERLIRPQKPEEQLHSPLAQTESDWMQQAVQSTPSGMILVDARQPDLPIVFVNAAFERTTGYTKAEVLGKNCRFLHRNDRDQPDLEVVRQAIAAQTSCMVMLRNYRKDGSMFWNELRIFPIQDSAGGVTHFVGIQNDVTARKKSEAALAKSEARYRQIFDTNRAIKLLIDPNTGNIKDANAAAVEFYGYSHDQLTAMRIQDINILSAEQVIAEMKRAVSQKQVFFEFRHRLASGEIRDVDVFSSPVDTSEGQFLYSIIVDVTGKRQMDVRYRALFEQSNDAVFIFDTNGQHMQVNQRAADMLGYSRSELVGLSYLDLIAPEERHQSRHVLKRVVEGDRITPYERTFRHKDGSLISTEINAEVVRDSSGNPIHIQSIVRDITQRKQMEAQLRENEQKFRTFIEQSSDGVVMTDENGVIIEWNQGMITFTGIPADEALGKLVWEVQYTLADGDAKTRVFLEQLRANILQACQTGSAPWLYEPVESLIHRKDGTQMTVQAVMFPIQTSKGYRIGSIIRDVTKRKWMEEQLRASEERQRALLHAIPDLIFRNRIDGTYLDIHAVDPKRLLAPVDEHLGKSVLDILPEPIASRQLSMMQQAMETGQLVIHEFELPMQGEPRRLEVRIVPSGKDEVLSIARDVTELWQTRQRLEQVNERLEFSVEAARIAWWEMNAATGEVQFDDRKVTMLGYDLKDFQNVTYHAFIRLVHPDDSPAMIQSMGDLLEGRKPLYSADYRMRTKSGKWVWLHDRGELTYNQYRQPIVRGFVIDITERKHAQQREMELALERERTHLLSEFVQGVAHEFRTPLSVISSSAYLLSRVSDEERRADKIKQIDHQVKRISRLVDMLLTMAKLESRDPLKKAGVNLKGVIEALCASMKQSALEPLPTLRCEMSSSLPHVFGDVEYLSEALQQILENAVRFTPPQGTITLASGIVDSAVWVEIRDTGTGITEDDLPHIFETFWRRDKAHTTPGFGLGLPIAQRIIEHHGGKISVTSREGQGTTFRVTLPLNN